MPIQKLNSNPQFSWFLLFVILALLPPSLSLSLPRCIDQLGESCSPIMQIEVDKQQQAWYAAVCNDAIYRFL